MARIEKGLHGGSFTSMQPYLDTRHVEQESIRWDEHLLAPMHAFRSTRSVMA